MTLSVGGLMSGLDTDSIVSQLMELERYPLTQLESREADFNLQLSTYGNLKNKLSSLNSAIKALDKVTDFAKFYKATSGDEDFFTTSAGSGAASGVYDIHVTNLAESHKLTSTGFGESESIGEGTLTIQVGDGTAIEVSVASGDTLEDIADAINDAGGDVSAGLIYDGSDYYLALTAKETGAANEIMITVDDTGDSNNTDANGLSRLAYEKGVTENSLSETRAAIDATVEVDGITISNASNVLDDVIDGVTINLVEAHDLPTDTTQLTISRDVDAAAEAIEAFVTAYNEVAEYINDNTGFDADSGESEVLQGDTTTRLIESGLVGLLKMTYPGMGSISELEDLGIYRNAADNTLTLTTSTLTNALEEDFDGVIQFFTQTTTDEEGFGVRMQEKIDDIIAAGSGTLSARQDGIRASLDDIENSKERVEARLTTIEARIRTQFNSLEVLLGQYQTTSDYLTQQLESLKSYIT
jgi:flagellar hook-associated protein 2